MEGALGERFRSTLWLLAAASLFVAIARSVATELKLGIALLHGELGAPSRLIDGLGQALAGAGYLVIGPDRCWSARRGYEAPFAECLATVDAAIVRLHDLGTTGIAVAGFSLGSTAAIAYCAIRPGRLGTIAIVPDHDARTVARRPKIAVSLDRARQLVANGPSNDGDSFTDISILRTYTMVPGRLGAWLALYKTDGLPLHRRHLGKPVGVFTTEVGTLNQVVFIWAFQDHADRERRHTALESDPDWTSYRRRSAEAGNVQHRENKIIGSTEFSSL